MMNFVLGSLWFPLTPERVTFTSGASVKSVSVLDLGTIEFPRGYDPLKISFGGIFPGPDRQNTLPIDPNNWQDPGLIVQILDNWRKQGTEVSFKIIQLGTYIPPIPVFVATLEWTYEFGFGDIYFKLALTESRSLRVMSLSEFTTGVPTSTPQPELNKPAVYTVKYNESLASIAKMFYGDESYFQLLWSANPQIGPRYDPNPPTPYLTVGTVLVIPGGSGP